MLVGVLAALGCSGDGPDETSEPTASSSAPSTVPAAAPDQGTEPVTRPTDSSLDVEADVEVVDFADPTCGEGFRELELPHTVEVRRPETQFDANGSGVAIADLDGDDRLDIVLGDLDGPTRVFWNDGGLEFTPNVLFSGRARAIQPVDVDADGDLDLAIGPGLGPG
jgi:hypothetical protein